MSRVYEQDFFVKAGVERVWQALTTPAQMEKWLGMKVLAFQPRQGGKIHVEGLGTGELVAFEPPAKLGWAWDPDDGNEPCAETMTLYAEDGGTRIHLHSFQAGRWGDDLMYRGGNIGGWRMWMAAVAGWVERSEEISAEPQGALGADWDASEAGDVERISITRVKPGGAAEAGGLQVEDVLRTWNERPLDEVATFWQLLWRSPVGARVCFGLERDGKPAEAEVVLG